MSEEFAAVQIRPHIVQIENRLGNCCTLVCGDRSAILFDTMSGIGDLRSLVKELTHLPVTVINSHGHFDHMGGNFQFGEVFMNHEDMPLLPRFEAWLDVIGKNAGADLTGTKESYRRRPAAMQEGMEWDLGGIHASAVSLPGHTPGSMGLLLREDRILLAADAVSPEMCLFFPESLPIYMYRSTLEKVRSLEADWFILGHYRRLFPMHLADRFLECARLPGRTKGWPYRNTLIPELKGTMYILEFRNPDADGTICLITKEDTECP